MRVLFVAALLMAGCFSTEPVQSDEPDVIADVPDPANVTKPPVNETSKAPETSTAPQNGTEEHNGTESNQNETESKPFEPEEASQSCTSLTDNAMPFEADPTGLVLGWELLQLDVVMLADEKFIEKHENWTEDLQLLVDDASTQFSKHIGVQLNVTAVLPFVLPVSLYNLDSEELYAWMRGYLSANMHDDYDYAALMLGGDYAGSGLGQVDCVTGIRSHDSALLWAEYSEPRGPSDVVNASLAWFDDIPLKVFMHESAHLFGSHHHYTNCGEAMLGYRTDDAVALCGLMINDIGLASFQMSPTNRLVSRSFIEEMGVGEPVS